MDLLAHLRAGRGFDVDAVLAAKAARLRRWFAAEGLDAAVVGVSGGVDSALVLALLQHVAALPESPLRRVVALLLPVGGAGATGQDRATERGRLVASALGAEVWEAPLTGAMTALVASLEGAAGLRLDPWAEGQGLSVLRTPALYGAAALLQQHGWRSVVVGTTNRDEGAYLGFFGKASDGMVDLQPISDLHKSEVRRLARCLGVPAAVVDAVPAGDLFDGRTDEELIGATYDEVEAVLRLRELGRDPAAAGPAAAAVERAHAANAHKYRVGPTAVHLDVLPRGVPGGWQDEVVAGRQDHPPPPGAIPGAWTPPPVDLDPPGALPCWHDLPLPVGLARVVGAVLTADDAARLRAALDGFDGAAPVGVTGVADGAGVGSMRATAWAPALADALWLRLAPAVPSVRFLDRLSPTDGFATATRPGHRTWRVVGLSPLLRWMRYEPGGRHLAHHDAGFDSSDGRRTLLSVVLYLTEGPGSGATRFVDDGQAHLPVDRRDHGDWARDTDPAEVLATVNPAVGHALVFDHRLCHDVDRWDGPGSRVVIRADVVYEAIPDGRS